MKVYKLNKPADTEMIYAITKLMMEQMNRISVGVTEESLLKTIEFATSEKSSSEFFIAEFEQDLVGCAFLNKGIGLDKGGAYIWLNDLYVKKQYRRQGIARKILLKVLHWAEQEGFKAIELETGINNIATKRLYNSLGFYDIISKRYGRTIT